MSLKAHGLAVIAFLAGVSLATAATDPPPGLSDYRITSWIGGDGITLGEVRSLAQDENGYLWLAADRGLIRFDGFRFATTGIVSGETPLPASAARAVHVARDGSLWVGYGDGYGVYRIVNGEVRATYLAHQINGFVNDIVEDHRGTIWIGDGDGLYRFRDGRWDRVRLPGAEGAATRVQDLHVDRGGRVWVAALGGVYRQADGDRFEGVGSAGTVARAVSEDAQGAIWTTDETSGVRRVDAPGHGALFEARGMRLLHDRRGNLWVTTIGQGIWQVRPSVNGAPPTVRHAGVQNGLVSDENSNILEDRDGNIWVASLQGLNRLTPNKVTSLPDLGVVHAFTFAADGTALAGTNAGLVALAQVTSESPGTQSVISDAAVDTLHTAADGTVWVGTGAGLHRLAAGRLLPVPVRGARLSAITAISSDRAGTLWICDSAEGLLRLEKGRLERVAVSGRPQLVHVDAADRVWMAFGNGTVGVLDAERQLHLYGPEQGLPHTSVTAIHHDRRGDLWIGGAAGLSRLRGDRFETLTRRNGLPALTGRPMVTGIVDDENGDLWVSIAYSGIVRLNHHEVERGLSDPSYRLRYRIYNTSDGVAYSDSFYAGNTAAGAPNATLWFVASHGMAALNPRELRQESAALVRRPRLEGISADDRFFGADGSVLPPRTSRVRIDYTVVSLSSLPWIQFRYRLDGFDRDWVDGTAPRQASYTNLPPGDYRFHLQSSSDATTWNDAEAAWSFSIAPMFYQTRWFYALCGLGLVLGATGAWRLRVRHVRKEVGLVFGERIRLAREIHDTLLQSLVGLSLQIDAATRDAREQPARTQDRLAAMRRQIEGYIREARRSIWDLRSPSLETAGLVGALRAAGDRLTAGDVRFAMTVSGTPRPCPAKVETQVLRIGHEAIMNAVRHARARNVHVEIGYSPDVLRLRVADDGCGFAPEAGCTAEHYGLMSMKERAADAGGRCIIESVPGSGVQIIAEFPLVAA